MLHACMLCKRVVTPDFFFITIFYISQVLIDGEPYALTTQRFSNANIKNRKQSARNARAELEMVERLRHLPAYSDRFEAVICWWAQSEQMQVRR